MNDPERIDRLEQELNDMRRELARYKGFLGGIVAVATAVGAFFEFVIPAIRELFKH